MPYRMPDFTPTAKSAAYTFASIGLLFLTAVLSCSIAACVLNNWLRMTVSSFLNINAVQGLWQACITTSNNNYCTSINNLQSGSCLSMVQAVQAFTIITIVGCFVTMVILIASMMTKSVGAAAWALGWSVFTMLMSVIPWPIYMGYRGNTSCSVAPGMTYGAGWCLSVSSFPLMFTAMFFLILWYVILKRARHLFGAQCMPMAGAMCCSPCPPCGDAVMATSNMQVPSLAKFTGGPGYFSYAPPCPTPCAPCPPCPPCPPAYGY
eukprot:RCo036529